MFCSSNYILLLWGFGLVSPGHTTWASQFTTAYTIHAPYKNFAIILLLVPYSCSWAVSVFHFNFDIFYKLYSTCICWIYCFKVLFSFRFMCFACLCARCMQYLRRPEEGTEMGVTDGATKWVLGSKARSCARALSHWVISPGPPPLCLFILWIHLE